MLSTVCDIKVNKKKTGHDYSMKYASWCYTQARLSLNIDAGYTKVWRSIISKKLCNSYLHERIISKTFILYANPRCW